jgi:CheY-like chemotaxis protein
MMFPMSTRIPTEKRRRRILFVDDHFDLLSTYERAFRHHEIVLVDTAEKALAELERHADFDLIVCDVLLPNIDGVALYRRVRAQTPEVAARFVFATGVTEPEERSKIGLDELGVPILEKPFGMGRIRQLLEAISG